MCDNTVRIKTNDRVINHGVQLRTKNTTEWHTVRKYGMIVTFDGRPFAPPPSPRRGRRGAIRYLSGKY